MINVELCACKSVFSLDSEAPHMPWNAPSACNNQRSEKISWNKPSLFLIQFSNTWTRYGNFPYLHSQSSHLWIYPSRETWCWAQFSRTCSNRKKHYSRTFSEFFLMFAVRFYLVAQNWKSGEQNWIKLRIILRNLWSEHFSFFSWWSCLLLLCWWCSYHFVPYLCNRYMLTYVRVRFILWAVNVESNKDT